MKVTYVAKVFFKIDTNLHTASHRTFQFRTHEERQAFGGEMERRGHKVSTTIEHLMTVRDALIEADRDEKRIAAYASWEA